MSYRTLDDWIRQEAIPFDLDSPATVTAAIDAILASLEDSVVLLGLGEALHGGEEILAFRNRLFQRLVEAHGFSAVAIESSFPMGRIANDYVVGRGPDSYEAVRETGISHGFGQLEANRELLEWMRAYNADPAHRVKLHFYGFDMPVATGSMASPRQVLSVVLDYLAAMEVARGEEYRQRIESLLGADADWENPAANIDPAQAVGLSPDATALRIATEDLLTELRVRCPELVARGGQDRYLEAIHYAAVARHLLNYHAATAAGADFGFRLGIRDAMMADNLAYIVHREEGRGRVLAFAHNSHLQRGQAVWPWYTFWPAGSQLNAMFGPRYAVIGTGVGTSEANGIGQPEPRSLEARLMALPGAALAIPTHGGAGLPDAEIAGLPTRSGSARNPSYGPLTARSFTDFDWLVVLDSVSYTRGGPPLEGSGA